MGVKNGVYEERCSKVLFGSINVDISQKGHFITHGNLCYVVFLITKYFH